MFGVWPEQPNHHPSLRGAEGDETIHFVLAMTGFPNLPLGSIIYTVSSQSKDSLR